MHAAEAAAATPLVDRYHLCFALGKALEDQQQYAESFEYYARGNALKRAESRYRPEVMELNTAAADRGLHPASCSLAISTAARPPRIRSSSSACRAPARR